MPTVPPTFNAGDILEADQLNQLGEGIVELQAVTEGVTFSGTKLNRTSNQSTTSGADETVTWTTEVFDYGGWWTSGTDIVVPSGAIPGSFSTIAVLILARVKFASNSTGNRRIQLQVNGSSIGSRTVGGLSGGDPTDVQIQAVQVVAAADVITVVGYQSSGGALDISEANVSVLRYAPAS